MDAHVRAVPDAVDLAPTVTSREDVGRGVAIGGQWATTCLAPTEPRLSTSYAMRVVAEQTGEAVLVPLRPVVIRYGEAGALRVGVEREDNAGDGPVLAGRTQTRVDPASFS